MSAETRHHDKYNPEGELQTFVTTEPEPKDYVTAAMPYVITGLEVIFSPFTYVASRVMSYFYPPKPPTLVTLAQVKFWGESLEQVISCPVGRWHFWSFCRTQPRLFKYLTFYISVYEWKRTSDERVKQSKALIIHEEWFRYASKMHISFDRPVLEKIYEKLKKSVVPRDVYDEAQQIVFEKMREISYPEYLRSPMYRELLEKLEKEGEGKAVPMFP